MADRSEKLETKDAEMVELRQEYDDAVDQKSHIRKEGDTDMRYISGNPWEDKDRRAREDANRPCLSLDEIGQHVNQLTNDIRQNKRGIKASPEGAGATDKTAETQQGIIRQIEYKSNAALSAYPIMFENAVQRGYGYLRIKPEWAGFDSTDQELRIKAIPNPNMVVEDPYALEPDGSDWKFLYFSEAWNKADFKAKWPNAKFQTFDGDAVKTAPSWLKGGRILLAERWRVVTKKRTLLLIQPPAPVSPAMSIRPLPPPRPFTAFKDDDVLGKLPPGAKVLKDREVDFPTLKLQITNGLEILHESEEPGVGIPFVSNYGKILYLENDGGTQRVLLSLTRLMRDPQMLYNFYRTCEAEVVGRVPKVTPVGYAGQFDGFEDDWVDSYHVPKAFLEVNATTPATGQGNILPLPQMQTWEPPIQALEMGAEAARRAIQSAAGISPLPTSAQRRNEKSGIALEHMEDSAQKGSFHFVDHYDFALVRTGQLLSERIPSYYDAARHVTVRDKQDQPKQIRINDPQDEASVSTTEGKHDITLSVGPQQISERKASSDFADSLLGSSVLQMMPPEKALPLVAMAIRLKDVGPIGDEMAEIISPKAAEGQITPEQGQQLQAQVKQLQQELQKAQQELEADKAKAQAQAQTALQKTQIETQSREKIEGAKIQQKDQESRADNETRLAVAELSAKFDRIALFLEERARLGVQQHEAEQAEADRQHEAALQAMSHGAAAGGQTADQQHAAEMQAEQQRAAAEQHAAAQAAQQQGGV